MDMIVLILSCKYTIFFIPQELSKLIELDVVAMDLFELQPLNIYEVYMKSFGRTGTEQVAVQTNDDNLEQETQTDDIETETRWSQFSNEVQAFGGKICPFVWILHCSLG